ncbi:MAG: four helix bundle protein, partial [Patescibacteria group bacterium]
MASEIKNFYNLTVWKKAHELTLKIYKATRKFPKDELYGLVSQLRRAVSSIAANIAEGFERYYFKDKIRFYYQARGSAAEVQNFLL